MLASADHLDMLASIERQITEIETATARNEKTGSTSGSTSTPEID
jgi:hypothetical protein